MKKVICLLLVAAMALGFVPAMGIQAFAASNSEEIDYDDLIKTGTGNVDIMLPDIYAGDTIDPDMTITVTGGTVASRLQWTDKYGDELNHDEFRKNTYYAFTVTINAPEGAPYNLGHVDFTVNRDWSGVRYHYGENMESVIVTVEIYVEKHPDTAGPIDVLLTMPTAEPGTVIPAKPEVIPDTRDVICTAQWAIQYPAGAVFEEGQRYPLHIWVTRADGRPFDDEQTNIHPRGSYSWSSGFTDGYRTYYMMGLNLLSQVEGCGPITLSNLPESITSGAATAPDVGVKEGMVDITGVQWVSADKQPVTTLEEGNLYYLAVSLQARSGYYIPEGVAVYQDTDGLFYEGTVHTDSRNCVVYYRYSLLKPVDEISVTVNQAQEGMSFDQLTATVQGSAYLKSITVRDAQSYQTVQETKFLENKTYLISYVIAPNAGWEFDEQDTEVVFSGSQQNANIIIYPDEITIDVLFSTCTPITQVELTASPEIAPGVAVDDVVLSADANAPYTVLGKSFSFDEEEAEDLEHFEAHLRYYMSFELQAKEGYVFSSDLVVTVDGQVAWTNLQQGGAYLTGGVYYGFEVQEIYISGIPDYVESGDAPEVEPYIMTDGIELVKTQWLNKNKQPVTTLKDGDIYYWAVTVESTDSRKFSEQATLYVDYEEFDCEYEKISDTQAVFYISYSLEPSTGNIKINSVGLEVGKNIEDLTAEVIGNAVLESITVWERVFVSGSEYYDSVEVTEGQFRSGSNYEIVYVLKAKDGYRFVGDYVVTIDGEADNHWNFGSKQVSFEQIFTTSQEISPVTVTLPEVAVGKDFSDLVPTAPQNAPYFVNYLWYDETLGETVTGGKVQEGHAYELDLELIPKEGYVFPVGGDMKLNGKELDSSTDLAGLRMEARQRFSFLKKITKVELPAGPASIKLGQTLSADYTVTGEHYTLSAASWMRYGVGEVTKVDRNDIYGLVFRVEAEEGYEFSEDAEVYIGGKPITNPECCYIYSGALEAVQMYFVGMKEITKVELTATVKPGKLPTVTIPKNANYKLNESAWTQNDDGSFDYENMEAATQLENGKYTFLGIALEVKDGYYFADDVQFYLNGTKLTPTKQANHYKETISFLPLGKLNHIDKLTAPKVSVSGKTLSWAAITNADAYEVYRATSKSGKYTKVATVTTTTWADDITPGKTYYYKVKAIYTADSSKNSDLSGYVSIDYKLDAPVISVENNDSGKPYITWEKVSGAKKYTIYVATSQNGTYKKLGTSTKIYYTDTKAKAGTTYFYKVIANASSSKYNSGYSNTVSCGVICGTPAVTVTVDTTTGKPSLSWKKADGAVKYAIYRQLPGEETFTLMAEQTAVSYADKTAPVDTVCQYYVQALGKTAELNGNPSKVVSATSGIPKPTITGSLNDLGQPKLSWKQVEGAVKYEVYRSTKSGSGYVLIQTVEGLTYEDASATIGKTYYYKVKAIGAVSKSADSSYVKLAGKCTAPVISVENNDSGKPYITWEKVSGAKKYTVYVATSQNGTYKKLGTSTKTYYTDTKAKAGTTYFYKVIANASSSKYNSGYSNIASCGVICGTPAVTATVDTTTGKPSLSWKKVDGAAKYAIYRKLPTDTQFVLQATQTAVSYKDTTAPVDTKCEYYVQALGKTEDLNGAVSKVVTATSGIAKPTVTGSLNDLGQPKLSWKQVEGAVKYEVYRSTKSGSGYVLIQTVEGLTCEDTTATIGKTYYYKVKAVGAVSKSADSSYVKLAGKCAAPVISVENNDSGKPMISWAQVSGAKKYTIYRATAEAGKYTKLGTTTKLTYTDTTAKAGNTYFYKVVANASSSKYDSGYSNIVSATHRLTSSSTAKDTGSDAIWEDPTANSRDYYEETDPNRTSYLEYIARYNNTLFFYLQEDSMRMYLGKTYGMPLIASQETMLACTWFSSDPSVATVNNMGFVTPLKLGNTVISVRYISPETGEEIIRNCDVRIENKPVYTVAQLEAAAKEEAKKIANYAMYEAGCTTDLERIAVAAALINTYVAEGKGGTYYAIVNGQLVEKKIAGYNQPYGTLVTFHSTCAGDVRALGMVLEYMGFQWYHVNADKNTHQWCVVYNVDGQTAFADGAQYGVVGYGERAEDQSNWMIYRNGILQPFR